MNPQSSEIAPGEIRPRPRLFAALLRLFGVLIFVVAFFLPAIRLEGSSTAPPPKTSQIPGWMCAEFATMMLASTPVTAFHNHGAGMDAKSVLLPMSGLVNPLVLVFLILCLWSRLVRTRLVIATLILACFVATWLVFAQTHTTPLIGHFLWVAGAVMLFVPDIAGIFSRPRPPSAIA